MPGGVGPAAGTMDVGALLASCGHAVSGAGHVSALIFPYRGLVWMEA